MVKFERIIFMYVEAVLKAEGSETMQEDTEREVSERLLEAMIGVLNDSQIVMLLESFEEEPELKETFKIYLDRYEAESDMENLENVLTEKIESCHGRKKKFFTELLYFVDRANLKDSQVYGKVNMDRKLWYRLRDHESAHTSKKNVLKMCIVLQLDYWETYYLMSLAGHAFRPFSNIDKTDYIVGLCVSSGMYDLERIEQLLEKVGEEPLDFGF